MNYNKLCINDKKLYKKKNVRKDQKLLIKYF